jgi:hypothetical protein
VSPRIRLFPAGAERRRSRVLRFTCSLSLWTLPTRPHRPDAGDNTFTGAVRLHERGSPYWGPMCIFLHYHALVLSKFRRDHHEIFLRSRCRCRCFGERSEGVLDGSPQQGSAQDAERGAASPLAGSAIESRHRVPARRTHHDTAPRSRSHKATSARLRCCRGGGDCLSPRRAGVLTLFISGPEVPSPASPSLSPSSSSRPPLHSSREHFGARSRARCSGLDCRRGAGPARLSMLSDCRAVPTTGPASTTGLPKGVPGRLRRGEDLKSLSSCDLRPRIRLGPA